MVPSKVPKACCSRNSAAHKGEALQIVAHDQRRSTHAQNPTVTWADKPGGLPSCSAHSSSMSCWTLDSPSSSLSCPSDTKNPSLAESSMPTSSSSASSACEAKPILMSLHSYQQNPGSKETYALPRMQKGMCSRAILNQPSRYARAVATFCFWNQALQLQLKRRSEAEKQTDRVSPSGSGSHSSSSMKS